MKIDESKCVGCCSCINTCKKEAIEFVNGKCKIDESKCINCGTCASVCPMSAISNE